MATYRAYRIDDRRHIRTGEWLQANDDAQAIAQASELCDPETPVIELWQAARLVDEIECGNDRNPEPARS
jgi:hypothetical protein